MGKVKETDRGKKTNKSGNHRQREKLNKKQLDYA